MKCPNCHEKIEKDTVVCPHCSYEIEANMQVGHNGFAIAGFVVSLISCLFFGLVFFNLVGVTFSAIGLGKKEEYPKSKNLARAGLWLGIIGAILWVILILWYVSNAA
ncbi:MAG: hypothetical protein LUC16_02505 [Coprobacillus sp.]|nr:hypothetical protein [Coprobacillus sp.]